MNLPSSNNLDRFLSENNENFRDTPLQLTLQRLYTTTGLSKAALAKQSGISEVYLHQLFSGRRFPSRSRLLRQARHAPLYTRDRRDAIILYGLSHSMTLFQINDKLFTEKLDTLC